MKQSRSGYKREYRKAGIKIKLTLYFIKERLKKLDMLRSKDAFNTISRASQIEKLVNKELDKTK
jgi:hypothetical protein